MADLLDPLATLTDDGASQLSVRGKKSREVEKILINKEQNREGNPFQDLKLCKIEKDKKVMKANG